MCQQHNPVLAIKCRTNLSEKALFLFRFGNRLANTCIKLGRLFPGLQTKARTLRRAQRSRIDSLTHEVELFLPEGLFGSPLLLQLYQTQHVTLS